MSRDTQRGHYSPRCRTPRLTGGETAEYAPLGRRAQAAALDWGICVVLYLLVSIPSGLLQLGSSVAGPAAGELDALARGIVVLAPASYLAGYLRPGQTLGMRALDLHVRVAGSGRVPGWIRAAGRPLLSMAFGTATYLTYFGLSEPPQGETWSTGERAALGASYLVAVAALAGVLWALADGRRQSLWDKTFGLVRLEDLTSASTDTARYNLWLQQRSGA